MPNYGKLPTTLIGVEPYFLFECATNLTLNILYFYIKFKDNSNSNIDYNVNDNPNM